MRFSHCVRIDEEGAEGLVQLLSEVNGSTGVWSGAELTASPVPALSVGFLLAGGAAIVGAASDLELSEGLVADGANTLAEGLVVCGGEFVKELLVLGSAGGSRRGLVKGLADKGDFGEGQMQWDHGSKKCYKPFVTEVVSRLSWFRVDESLFLSEPSRWARAVAEASTVKGGG